MRAAFALSVAGLLFCFSAGAHPGSGIAVDPEGRVFFAAGPLIVLIETNGAARTIIHDSNHEKFYQLHHIQPAPGGGWLTASDLGNAIWRFTHEGTLSRFYPPPNGMRALAVGTGGDPFAVDSEGNVYATNSEQNRFTQVLKVTSAGLISVLAGGDWGYADGRGSNAKFGHLHSGSMIVAPDGALLLTDEGLRVRRVAPDGWVTTLAGGAKRGFVDGKGSEARFDGARGLALDPEGNLLVVETSGRIRRITPAGIVKTLAGRGARGHVDGRFLEAIFDAPTGIAAGANGDIFILEPGAHRVRKISGGRVTTLHEGIPAMK
jgi:streptogramin lyase